MNLKSILLLSLFLATYTSLPPLVLSDSESDLLHRWNELTIRYDHFIKTGELTDALRLATKALGLARDSFSTESREVASALENLGTVNFNLERPNPARKHFEQAIEIRRHYKNRDLARYLYALQGLANAHAALANYQEARELFNEIFAKRISHFGRADLQVARTFVDLGELAIRQGSMKEAHKLLDQAHEIFKDYPSHDINIYVDLLEALAYMHRDRGNLDKAERLLLRALRIRSRVCGPKSAYVGLTLTTLAWVHWDLGKRNQWQEEIKTEQEMLKQTCGVHSLQYEQTLVIQGLVSHEAGDYSRAESFFRKALKTIGGMDPIPNDELAGVQVRTAFRSIDMVSRNSCWSQASTWPRTNLGEASAKFEPYLRALSSYTSALGVSKRQNGTRTD
ncbi:tetratricopeptide repeat protein [Thermodesulfobacteriota bacterium]